jgi:hypothetical protein
MIALALAPDRTNAGPYFVRFREVPYEGVRRGEFIVRERPLVLRQMPPGEPVQKALEELGYIVLVRAGQGELLAPGPLTSEGRPFF